MSEFMEFQGKNLDEAINTACDHFGLNRDKLEIEIISGGSTGVFGLVGKKNAKVKARPRGGDRSADNRSANDDSRRGRGRQQRRESEQRAPRGDRRREEQVPAAKEENAPAPRTEPEVPAVKPDADLAVKEEGEVAVKPDSEVAVREDAPAPAVAESSDAPQDEVREERAEEQRERREPRSIMEGDPEEIAAAVREALEMMIEPIIQDKPNLEVEVGEDRVNVLVNDEENSGLIIGREGQTLSSLQYLCNRMVSKKLQTSVRVQIDTGDYRERQDEKLRQLAWHLADKAMHTGRVQSTKPLSSYHRRVVHMALQEDKHVNTRSKGEGPMKRVLILPRRSRSGGPGRRNDNYSRGNDRYDSRSNDRSRGRRNDRNDRNDNFRGRRNERTERNDRNERTERNDNYRGRRNDRNDNYNRGRRNDRNDNYNNRSRDENFGNREEFNRPAPFDDNYGNRYQRDDNFGNRQSRYNNNRRNDRNNDRNKDGNSTNYNSERYNRY
ncbi:RNA-binding cell elongation regulator Jag/EloR [Desulfovibrio sp. JC010]|uniref:RNA-binding cell elongation regulator Jag/EloR n=1 Tax=Desulfovibrio sp. JC010 TaxID=2593641 RepID=UPI0013D4247C|nr:RNA-binding cell elongation regulator Jag/EloR [Desulfovibrio sp. JC010]NDV25096.1 KH domain-containing protein [Desulfovibrio sp. JC010]